jgi:hypothetical protein
MRNRIFGIVASVSFACALVGCGGGGVNSSSDTRMQISPAGSDVTAQNGVVRMIAPAGAVATTQIITVTSQTNTTGDANVVNGTMFRFAPTSFAFLTGVTLIIRYNESELGGSAESGLVLSRWNGSSWVDIGGSIVDESGNTVSGTITLLGTYAIRKS